MTAQKVECPICGAQSVVSQHKLLSKRSGELVPSFVYTCHTDGWFSLSEAVNEQVTKLKTPENIKKLAKIVAETYFPSDLWPAEPQPIESLD
ncbi:hypothetical protein F8O53_25815 [Enterobacter sp. 63]